MEALSNAVGAAALHFARELRVLAGVAVALASLGLAACGGGDFEDDEPPQPPVGQFDGTHTKHRAGPQPGTGPR